MYLAIIVLPLLGSIVSGFFGRKVGVNGAQILTTFSVITTMIFAIFAFFEVTFNNISVSVSLLRWLDLESINVLWEFNFDFLTVSMLIPVLIISSLVHVYSIGYMDHDPHNQRFFSYLSLFTFMMIILVTSNNLLLMFVGWEGVGVCSYLLVNFWFTRIAANQSSVSAFLTNRVGDCFLTIGMIIILLTFGNLDYTTIFSIAPYISQDSITVIGICLLIGAMAKSSQIGLHVWLPLAMEGPTPVSALIHAATMVTAGVYLLIRVSPLIEYSSTVLLISLWVGSITTVFSSIIGLFQQDIKKVIAYSTMSQLGMMVIAIGLSSYNIALFHLVNHAFYKGLLFLGAGAVIHAVADNQDFRKYGGLINFLPLSYTIMLIASLSLVAFPFMTGFYSKDFILESSFAQFDYTGTAVYITALIGANFTIFYSIKILYLTFISNANGSIADYNNTHEGNIFMSLPLVILALFSVFFGFLTKDIFVGIASHAFTDNSLFIHPSHEISISGEFAVSQFFKLLPFFLIIIISILSIFILEFVPKTLLYFKSTRTGYNMFNFFNLKFLVESIYNRYITYLILNIGGQTTKILDKGSVEKLGPYGLEKSLITLSKNLNYLNTGIVTTYALYILMGFILYIYLPYFVPEYLVILFLIIYTGLLFTLNNDKTILKDKIVESTVKIPGSENVIQSNSNAIWLLGVFFTCFSICAELEIDTQYINYKIGIPGIFEYSDSIKSNNLNKEAFYAEKLKTNTNDHIRLDNQHINLGSEKTMVLSCSVKVSDSNLNDVCDDYKFFKKRFIDDHKHYEPIFDYFDFNTLVDYFGFNTLSDNIYATKNSIANIIDYPFYKYFDFGVTEEQLAKMENDFPTYEGFKNKAVGVYNTLTHYSFQYSNAITLIGVIAGLTMGSMEVYNLYLQADQAIINFNDVHLFRDIPPREEIEIFHGIPLYHEFHEYVARDGRVFPGNEPDVVMVLYRDRNFLRPDDPMLSLRMREQLFDVVQLNRDVYFGNGERYMDLNVEVNTFTGYNLTNNRMYIEQYLDVHCVFNIVKQILYDFGLMPPDDIPNMELLYSIFTRVEGMQNIA